jgi:hypothetical protein
MEDRGPRRIPEHAVVRVPQTWSSRRVIARTLQWVGDTEGDSLNKVLVLAVKGRGSGIFS